ncbi:MAG: PID-CTERM protein-sorting domain-containing protein [Chitinophagaceae bacterium]
MPKKIKTIVTLCFIVALIIPSLTHAQPAFDDDVNDVPVDGGLSLLIAAGVGYGVQKLKKKKKEEL